MYTRLKIYFFLSFLLLFNFNVFSYSLNPYNPCACDGHCNTFNLVFVSLSCNDEQAFQMDVRSISEKLLNTVPFNEFKDRINIEIVKLSSKEENQFFKKEINYPYLSVLQKFLNSIAEHIDGNFKLVIINYAGSIVSAEMSSIEDTSLIVLSKQSFPEEDLLGKSFLHELGHSLGLKDECIHCNKIDPGLPNCAPTKQEAEKWWGDLIGKEEVVNYYVGCCGDKNNFRPTGNSVMNDFRKAEDYELVNERYLRSELKKFIGKRR